MMDCKKAFERIDDGCLWHEAFLMLCILLLYLQYECHREPGEAR